MKALLISDERLTLDGLANLYECLKIMQKRTGHPNGRLMAIKLFFYSRRNGPMHLYIYEVAEGKIKFIPIH